MKKFWSAFLVFSLLVSLFSVALGCPAPIVTSLSVTQGANNEIVDLTITGSQFHKSTYIKLTKASESDILASNVKVVSKTEVTCTLDLNGKTVGQWDVVVANIGSMSKKDKPTVLKGGFTIEYPGLKVTGIQPNQGMNNGIVRISKISGANFRPGAKVILTGDGKEISATKVTVLTTSEITCELDLNGAAPGTYSVKVINEDGKSGSTANIFTVSQAQSTAKPTPEPTAVPETKSTPAPVMNKQLTSIFFDFDKSALRSDQAGRMKDNLDILKDNPKMLIILGGHASEQGTPEYNMALSARRNDTVKQYLIDAGIAPERIIVYAFGEDHPLKKGHDEASRSFNRRVDVLMWNAKLSEEQVLAETIR